VPVVDEELDPEVEPDSLPPPVREPEPAPPLILALARTNCPALEPEAVLPDVPDPLPSSARKQPVTTTVEFCPDADCDRSPD
jgi:hypothetical protein